MASNRRYSLASWVGLAAWAIACTPREHAATSPVAAPAEPTDVEAPASTTSSPSPCLTVEAEIEQVLAPLTALAGELSLASEGQRLLEGAQALRTCHADVDGGAWVLMPESVKHERFHSGHLMTLEVPFRPVYLHPDGTRARRETAMTFYFAPELEDNYENAHDFKIAVQLFDYDGDGRSELILTTESQAHEDFDRSHAILGVVDGVVKTYAPLEGVDIWQLVDYDGDGRLDVVSIEVHYTGTHCFDMYGYAIGVPPVLYHSTPGGSFSFSDEVAARFLREKCPSKPVRLLDLNASKTGAWDMDARQAIACARMLGATAEELTAQIRREWSSLPRRAAEESCGTTLDEMLDIARRQPIVSL